MDHFILSAAVGSRKDGPGNALELALREECLWFLFLLIQEDVVRILPANDLPLRFTVLLKTSQADVYKVVVVRWIQPGSAARAKHFCPNPTEFEGVVNKPGLVVCCNHSVFFNIWRWTQAICFSAEVCVMRLLLLMDAASLNSTARHKVFTT